MKNNLAFLKQFAGLFGVCCYSFLYPLSSYTFSLSRSMECKENYSYSIFGREFVNKKDNFKKFPTKFLENSIGSLETFKVSYDLNKGIGNINGSHFKVMGGNLENIQTIKSSTSLVTKEIETKPKGSNSSKTLVDNKDTITEKISRKNYLVPITLFSSIQDLVEIASEEGDSLTEDISISEEKKFFTIENHYKSSPEFTFIKVLKKDNQVFTIDSNDKETNTNKTKKTIEVSTGKCKLLK